MVYSMTRDGREFIWDMSMLPSYTRSRGVFPTKKNHDVKREGFFFRESWFGQKAVIFHTGFSQ